MIEDKEKRRRGEEGVKDFELFTQHGPLIVVLV